MKIPIVEDEKKTGDHLLQGLTASGFVTDLASNGVDVLRWVQTTSWSNRLRFPSC